MRRASNRPVGVTVVLLVVVLLGAACGGDHDMPMDGAMPMDDMDMSATMSTNPIAADAEFNAADVQFAQGMIVHHGQAIQMADQALATSTDPDVLRLAQEIKVAQEPEIMQMVTWLESWNQPVPDPMMDHRMLDHGDMPMSGMIGPDQMAALSEASGSEFDQLFLVAMVEHHRGAVEMARYALDNGRYPPLSELAQAVITVQEAEIAEMETLLGAR